MEPINRGTGLTESERYLASLADRTFLDLWSYPNTFNDRNLNGLGIGQEICDLLVVCGDDVIVFSDKSIRWSPGDDVSLSWTRWYRRAVSESLKQIKGAARWLSEHPDRIFIDSRCAVKLPIELPAPDRMRVHGVALAFGAQEACSKYFNHPDGSLLINSDLKGKDHVNVGSDNFSPFAFGDVNPDGSFIHVFDETALNLVLREMDTITDFVDYLAARERIIRYGRIGASSEADMLAAYLQVENADGAHDFPTPEMLGEAKGGFVAIEQGEYARYRSRPEVLAKAKADRVSYAWDRLIGEFTRNLLEGTSVKVADMQPEVRLAERAARAMALERRTARRALSEALLGAIEESERQGKGRFARVLVEGRGFADPEAGYVFVILAHAEALAKDSYEKYRETRIGLLRAYCEVALLRNRHLKRMLGIAFDASPKLTGKPGGSEDLMLVEIEEWTPAHEARVEQLARDAEILVPSRLRRREYHSTEFPSVEPRQSAGRGNRQQRRAAMSKARRRR